MPTRTPQGLACRAGLALALCFLLQVARAQSFSGTVPAQFILPAKPANYVYATKALHGNCNLNHRTLSFHGKTALLARGAAGPAAALLQEVLNPDLYPAFRFSGRIPAEVNLASSDKAQTIQIPGTFRLGDRSVSVMLPVTFTHSAPNVTCLIDWSIPLQQLGVQLSPARRQQLSGSLQLKANLVLLDNQKQL